MSDSSASGPGISWRRTGGTSDHPTMDAWCALVGPPVVATPERVLDGPVAAGLDSLVVVTWNVHVGGGDLVRFVGDLRAGHLTGGEAVGDFVLLVQEAYRGGPAVPSALALGVVPERIEGRPPSGDRLDVLEAARRLGLHLFYTPSMRNGRDGDARAEDRGNAILSTLPLDGFEAIELPWEVQRRVAVAGTIAGVTSAGDPWSLRLVSAHLDTRTRWTRLLDTFGSARARQAQALADAIGDPVVVLGADLNSWSITPLEEAVPLLRGRFPSGPVVAAPTLYRVGIGFRLDHLLFRIPDGWDATLSRVDDRYGSDHHPLISVVRLGV